MTTNTQHFLNEATLIRGIARDEVESFADIPEHLVTDTIIRHWIVRSPLDGVPLHRLNHIMRDMAVAANPENIKFFNPQNCDNYTHLLKTALCNPFFDIKHAVIEEITPQLLVASYKKNGGCISEYMKYKVWPSDEDRIDFANNLIALDPWLLVSPPVNIDEIRDESIVKGVEKLNDLDFFVSRLIKSGRHRVFDLLAANDHWIRLQKPKNLMEAVWHIIRVDRSTVKAEFYLLAAYIRQHPIEEVCSIMARGRTRQEIVSRQEMLVELFPSQQLLPFIKDMPIAKRHLLSTDFDL